MRTPGDRADVGQVRGTAAERLGVLCRSAPDARPPRTVASYPVDRCKEGLVYRSQTPEVERGGSGVPVRGATRKRGDRARDPGTSGMSGRA